MKMFDYSLLEIEEQLDLLQKEGVFIGKIRQDNFHKMLYQYDSFYVEITYRKYRYAVERLRCFESTRQLDPYLRQMNIEVLINS
jgi:hypothetical protein